MKISNTLLANVLDWGEKECTFFKECYINKNTLEINLSELGNLEINIYEFTFKCKKWARDNGYEIIVFEEKDKTFYCTIIPKYNMPDFSELLTSVHTYSKWSYSNTQTAIIEACEWILQQAK